VVGSNPAKEGTLKDKILFQVAKLAAEAPEGVTIEWQGRQLASGPLQIQLDEEAGASGGSLDYAGREAVAEFRVKMSFPELAREFEELGADAEFSKPFRATIQSMGPILDDHSFALSGTARIEPHTLLDSRTHACVLPGT